MGSKNNPSNRGVSAAKKSFNNQVVIPALFIGTQVGKGKFMCAVYESNGNIVEDNQGNPIPWDAV